MVTVEYGWGNRLGNTLLMYTAGYVFAKKHNLRFNVDPCITYFTLDSNYQPTALISTGFNDNNSPLKSKPLTTTRSCKEPYIPVHDLNFLPLLNSPSVQDAEYHFQHYFQLKDFVLPYRQEIKDSFELNYQPRPEKEIFVIVRLGDVAKRRQRLPLQFYIDAIERLYQEGCYGGYITSDSPQHPDVLYLMEKYNLKFYSTTLPVEAIAFGKDFNNLVLSEGTYCWWVGALSNAKNVYCNNRRNVFAWHGDIFVYPDWKYLSYDCPELPIDRIPGQTDQ